jgi:hypothetical protein
MKKILSIIMTIAFIGFAVSAFAGASSVSGSYSNQQQGQGQGQSQTFSPTMENVGNSAVVFQDSFNGAKPIRYTPVASDIQYQGLSPQMFARPEPDKGENFIAAKTLVELMGAWKISEINDEDIDESEIFVDMTMVGKAEANDQGDDNDVVTFALKGSPESKSIRSAHKTIALGTIKCDEDDINSAELFMVLAKKAYAVGAHNVILLSEGIKIELESSGWGVGFSYNYASVNSDLYGQGSVGAGGTGISGGSASYKKMPYLTFALLD